MNNNTMSDQPLIIVGSYADADQPGIHLCRFDDRAGMLTSCGNYAGIVNPSFLALHPNRRWLYVVSETSHKDGTPGSVWALSFDAEVLTIQPINQQPSGGDWPCHLQIDGSGEWMLVSNYGSGTVAVLPILPDGSLGAATDVVQHTGRSVHPERQNEPHAHSATLVPDNRFAIVADLGIDQLIVYEFDALVGKLAVHSHANTRPGAGPRHMAFHPTDAHVYVANELDNTVSLYDYDGVRGTLSERQTVDTLPPGVMDNTVADIHISPSGDRLYVSNRGHNSIAVFDIEANGRLSRIAIAPCGGRWPRNFALDPSGRFMLVANQHSDDVSVLPLLAAPQAIGDTLARTQVKQASYVQWVNVYA